VFRWSASLGIGLSYVATKAILLAFGIAGILWGVKVYQGFSAQSPNVRTAHHIIEGEPFKTKHLTSLLPAVAEAEQAEVCRPVAVESGATIRLRLLEDAIASGERTRIDTFYEDLRTSVVQSLACAPANPFLWLVLFSVETAQSGFSSHQLDYLRMSYRLGPNEGWVARKRSRIGLGLFELLPLKTANAAVRDFVGLVDSGFLDDAVEIFIGPARQLHQRLSPALLQVSERNRQLFANALYRSGYDADVPGIARRDPRPWR